MAGAVIVIHVIACIGLIFFILIQQGRGGGLIESFSSAESLFGTKTNTFLTKATTGFAITFFITCLLLAVISIRQSKSIINTNAITQQQDAAKTESEEKTEDVNQEEDNAIDQKQ